MSQELVFKAVKNSMSTLLELRRQQWVTLTVLNQDWSQWSHHHAEREVLRWVDDELETTYWPEPVAACLI